MYSMWFFDFTIVHMGSKYMGYDRKFITFRKYFFDIYLIFRNFRRFAANVPTQGSSAKNVKTSHSRLPLVQTEKKIRLLLLLPQSRLSLLVCPPAARPSAHPRLRLGEAPCIKVHRGRNEFDPRLYILCEVKRFIWILRSLPLSLNHFIINHYHSS